MVASNPASEGCRWAATSKQFQAKERREAEAILKEANGQFEAAEARSPNGAEGGGIERPLPGIPT